MNRFKVIPGSQADFERVWTTRDTHLRRAPGFVEFHLLRGPEREDDVLFASHTIWRSRADFEAWTKSEAFRLAHQSAGQNKPLYKEELHAINEELQTVTSELKLKLEAESRAHSDLQNLMAATDFCTLFLDSSLRIKRFTDRVTNLFSLTPIDEGRPITDFAHQLEYDDLIEDARGVISDLVPIRREIHSRDNHWYNLQLRPYRILDDKIDGVVITFVDIT